MIIRDSTAEEILHQYHVNERSKENSLKFLLCTIFIIGSLLSLISAWGFRVDQGWCHVASEISNPGRAAAIFLISVSGGVLGIALLIVYGIGYIITGKDDEQIPSEPIPPPAPNTIDAVETLQSNENQEQELMARKIEMEDRLEVIRWSIKQSEEWKGIFRSLQDQQKKALADVDKTFQEKLHQSDDEEQRIAITMKFAVKPTLRINQEIEILEDKIKDVDHRIELLNNEYATIEHSLRQLA